MRLLQMIKDSSNGPEQAKRRIEELDKMVQGLKKKRRLCGEQMESDKKRLYWLNKEIQDVEKIRYGRQERRRFSEFLCVWGRDTDFKCHF